MGIREQVCVSIIQLNNGSEYEVSEDIEFIEMLLTDVFIPDTSFLTFHFPDGFVCKIKKCQVSSFYENK